MEALWLLPSLAKMPVVNEPSERMKKFKNRGKDAAVSMDLGHLLPGQAEPAGALVPAGAGEKASEWQSPPNPPVWGVRELRDVAWSWVRAGWAVWWQGGLRFGVDGCDGDDEDGPAKLPAAVTPAMGFILAMGSVCLL